MMEDQTLLTGLDSLLLQLALETRELAKQKEDLKQQNQICKSNIQEKKNHIAETLNNIKKLEEEILQKQNTVKCYKDNLKSLRKTSALLLEFLKTLETELERMRDSCNQDAKIFQERIENYRKIFQQHKEDYCQNPLAKKLLTIQTENEEIEKRIRATEERIVAVEKELKALQGDQDISASDKKSFKLQAPPSESSAQAQLDTSSHEKLPTQDTETKQDDVHSEMENRIEENNQDQTDGCDESKASQVGTVGSIIWEKHEIRCESISEAEQKQQEQKADVDCNKSISCGSDVVEEMMKVMEVEDQQGTNEKAAPPSPVGMTAALNTPTFSLNSSPSNSPGGPESSETPAFVFSLNSGPSTPGLPGFGFGFDIGSNQNEKSPETKLPGFLFHELDCRPEEGFPFSFGSKNPQPSSSTQESEGTGEAFPFSFSFGKF